MTVTISKWTEDLSVNVVEIDAQHKTLFKIIADLSEAMQEGKSKGVLQDILEALAEYAITHFTLEEKYFEEYVYPKKASHKQAHDDFVKKVAEFKGQFEEGKLMLSMDVMSFLNDWLIEHISKVDQEYSGFFNEHGLS